MLDVLLGLFVSYWMPEILTLMMVSLAVGNATMFLVILGGVWGLLWFVPLTVEVVALGVIIRMCVYITS